MIGEDGVEIVCLPYHELFLVWTLNGREGSVLIWGCLFV